MRNTAIFLALLLAACGGGGSSPPLPNPSLGLNPALWTIGPIINGVDDSPGMPLHPTADPSGWSFQFPLTDGVHYISTAASAAGKSTMTMTYEIDVSSSAVKFVPTQGTEPNGLVRFYLQRSDDDWSRPDGRWWSPPTTLAAGMTTVTFPITGWTGVQGQVDAASLAAAKAVSGTVGFTFGGEFAGHGVYVTGGNAKFILKSFKLQ